MVKWTAKRAWIGLRLTVIGKCRMKGASMSDHCELHGICRFEGLRPAALAAGLLIWACSAACDGSDWNHVKSWVYQLTN
jgi:hypothetical protein